MCKSMWTRVIACLSIVVVLSLSALPLIASAENVLSGDPWGQSSIIFSEPITLTNKNWISYQEFEIILDIVMYAYRGGMFGGAYPIAVGFTIPETLEGGNSGFTIAIYTVNHSPARLQPPNFTQSYFFDNANTAFNIDSGSSSISFSASWMPSYSTQYTTYFLSDTGNFIIGAISTASFDFSAYSQIFAVNRRINPQVDGEPWIRDEIIIQGQPWCYISPSFTSPSSAFARVPNNSNAPEEFLTKIEAIRQNIAINASVFDDGYDDGYDDGHDEGVLSGYQTGYNQGLVEGETLGFDLGYADGYQNGLEDGNAPVTLDIPSIFTAMFRGVHSIFSGFDINIFGISIAGMLLGCLLIVVVAFIIKKIK